MLKSAFLSVNVILELLQAEGGILTRHSHHSIRHQLDYCLRRGTLFRLLPGIYTAPDPSWPARCWLHPSAPTASSMEQPPHAMWWPDCPMTTISAAIVQQVAAFTAGYAWERRVILDDLVVNRGQLRIACPAVFSSSTWIPTLGGQVIDEGLRRQAVDATLHRALEVDAALFAQQAAQAACRRLTTSHGQRRNAVRTDCPRRRNHRLGHKLMDLRRLQLHRRSRLPAGALKS